MAYIGYYDDKHLPFKRGETVVIPKGVQVYMRTHPSKKGYVTKRSMEVKINHILPGQTVPERDYERYHKAEYPDCPHSEEEVHPGYTQRVYYLQNPRICWAGTGGYWCEAEINDILQANGVVE
jgi:hypothetical protein